MAWKAFTYESVKSATRTANIRTDIMLVVGGGDKIHSGWLVALTPNEVELRNGNVTRTVHFNGPPRKFTLLPAPEFKVEVKSRELNLN